MLSRNTRNSQCLAYKRAQILSLLNLSPYLCRLSMSTAPVLLNFAVMFPTQVTATDLHSTQNTFAYCSPNTFGNILYSCSFLWLCLIREEPQRLTVYLSFNRLCKHYNCALSDIQNGLKCADGCNLKDNKVSLQPYDLLNDAFLFRNVKYKHQFLWESKENSTLKTTILSKEVIWLHNLQDAIGWVRESPTATWVVSFCHIY